jgi:hypothetical protein
VRLREDDDTEMTAPQPSDAGLPYTDRANFSAARIVALKGSRID